MNKIVDMFQPKCIHRHTAKTHPKCFENGKPTLTVENSGLDRVKILSIDIETLPILGYSWGVWNQNIYSEQIKKDWCLLSYSAKWINNPNVISSVLSPKEAINRDDKRLSEEIWKLLEQASIIIGHNSKRFDIKKINTRFWKHGLHRPSSYKHIDTLLVARSVFGLTYNKLGFIAQFKEIQDKLETDFELWERCDSGDPLALKEMLSYNDRDVEIQEMIYLEMRDWIPNHPRLDIMANLSNVCPVCLGTNYKEIGLYMANKIQYPEYRCSCGSTWHDTDKASK